MSGQDRFLTILAMKLGAMAHPLFRAIMGSYVELFGLLLAPHWKMPMDLVKHN